MSASSPIESLLHSALSEEEHALAMAIRITAHADTADSENLAAELEVFKEYLAGDLETHLNREETDVFPRLAARGLESEVAEASRQHGELRLTCLELAAAAPSDPARTREVLRSLGTLLAQHVEFEADFLYVDLKQDELEAFRAKLKSCAVLCAAEPSIHREVIEDVGDSNGF